ncbi:MAG: FliI/YscN family ATPase [Deltaproteobacteria bacterium]|nr:FliI/YscN family ATPase [Deltaproteobacteria bacterium]MCB9787794.1 FliI/YscN family ATPase [Deltaproteobacteria bacterium]
MELPWDRIDHVLAATPPIRVSGRVVRVGGLLVEGTMPGAKMGMMCRLMLRGDDTGVPAEIVALHDRRVSLMPLSAVPGITVGTRIEPGDHDPSVPVTDEMIGRVLDGWGQPIDGGPPIFAIDRVPLQPAPLNPMERGLVERPLPLGIRAVDGLLTSGEGQRVVIMAGAGVGKSTLLGMMARNTEADVTVVALIGERSREVKKFVQGELGAAGLSRSIVVSSTSNTAVALRIRAARVATSIAEYFRDQGQRVLLLMDSLTRVCMAQRELGLATGEPPTTRGYPPSAFDIIPQLLERAGPGTRGGSITACYTALLEGDDLTDPIGDAIRAVTDGHIVLSRKLAEQGHFPAIDVLASTSRVMSEVTTEGHRRAAADIRRVLSDLFEAEELQSVAAFEPGTVPRFDRAMALGPEVRGFLRQRSDDTDDFETTRQAVLRLGERTRQPDLGGGA